MAGIRIRWMALGRVTAIAVAGLAALQILPGLLRAPQPPPLGADVGLPRVTIRSGKRDAEPARPAPRNKAKPKHSRNRPLPALAPGVISSTPRRYRSARQAAKPPAAVATQAVTRPPSPPPPPPPATVVQPATATAPEPPPPPPNDGSVEFAPH